jgi:hypothetical protein
MSDILDAAKKLVDTVEFDCNGVNGKGGNGGLLSDATIKAAGALRIALSRVSSQRAHQETSDKPSPGNETITGETVRGERCELHPTFASTPAPVDRDASWKLIDSAPKNVKVLAAYQNELGNWRIVTACYHTQLEWSDEYGDHEEEYAPEAWYEENDSSEVIYPTSRQPTHWMHLPSAPVASEIKP